MAGEDGERLRAEEAPNASPCFGRTWNDGATKKRRPDRRLGCDFSSLDNVLLGSCCRYRRLVVGSVLHLRVRSGA
jgi:hypothetical protein